MTRERPSLSAGIDIPPFWKIVPASRPGEDEGVRIVIHPGRGFGNGTHETTQLCLQAIAALSPRGHTGWRMLDFGSGSGILSIGAAKLGATVAGIEIDELAIEHAEACSRLNGVTDRVRYARTLADARGPFDMIVANILRPVLLEHAGELTDRLDPEGTLVLSGLVSTDVPEVSVR
jgi:ribosomal protein L11 methyltransferase